MSVSIGIQRYCGARSVKYRCESMALMTVVCSRSVPQRCTRSESRTSRQKRSSASAVRSEQEPRRVSCRRRFSALSTMSGEMLSTAATQAWRSLNG